MGPVGVAAYVCYPVCHLHIAALAVIPVIYLVGAPNVGKSSLFNLVTHGDSTPISRIPGTTACSRYGAGRLYRRAFGAYNVVDTEGYGALRHSACAALDYHAAIMVLDASVGVSAEDEAVARRAIREGRVLYAAVNKSDPGRSVRRPAALPANGVFYTSCAHNTGVRELMMSVLISLSRCLNPCCTARHARRLLCDVRVAVAGSCVSGKTTLMSALAGAGTARSEGLWCRALHVMVGKHTCSLHDAPRVAAWSHGAGTHRLPLLAMLRAIASCDVVLLVIRNPRRLYPQDSLVLGYARRRRKPVVVCSQGVGARAAAQRRSTALRTKAGALLRSLHGVACRGRRLYRQSLERMREAINSRLRSEGIKGRAGCVRQGGSIPLRLIITCRNASAMRRRAGCIRAAAQAAMPGCLHVALLDIREDSCSPARG
ncbi:putative 50S ribosomal subunit stability factor [Candidatus Tremblaya princeps PCIT]|uniref:Putative 50S ribosomal subunit stability factor n=1 Tax=Tremblaya princeps (strain PCIT) TaxID=891398 RepID=F7XYH3_TREPP|nr:putative 50S ribosomal subunit stability factor [Candidatus Tremblaya princeps PCIT]